MGLVISVLILYCIPTIIMYLSTKYMYKHIWTHTKPGPMDMFFVLCPYANIMAILPLLLDIYSHKKNSKFRTNKGDKYSSLSEKFFKLNK